MAKAGASALYQMHSIKQTQRICIETYRRILTGAVPIEGPVVLPWELI